MDIAWDIAWNMALGFWITLGQMAPYLLFGFLFAGVLSVLISQAVVERHLGGSGFWPVAKASIFGIPLPLCSCGVIPVTASLRQHGASRPASTSFLLSTPQTGVDSILVTYSLLGPVFAVFRPVAAFVSGLVGGGLVAVAGEDDGPKDDSTAQCVDQCCSDQKGKGPISRILTYGLVTLPRDIGKALLIGLVAAGAIGALVPDDFLAGWIGGGVVSMVVMMLVGVPVYVCATASVPVAAALVAKGVSPGAALVFLMTGPATNAAAITTIWRVMGKRTAVVYLATVAGTALASGLALDWLYSAGEISIAQHLHEPSLGWLEIASALALIAVLFLAMFRRGRDPAMPESHTETTTATTLVISGMNCNSCVESVRRALMECDGVESAGVELKSGQARVSGSAYDLDALRRSVEELGFDVGPPAEPTRGNLS